MGSRGRFLLLAALTLVVIGLLLFVLGRWLAPVRLIEGPMIQRTSQTGATVVWYLSRPARCTLTYVVDGRSRRAEVERSGTRFRARLSNLKPGTSIPYSISRRRRTLVSATLRSDKTSSQAFKFVVFGDSGVGTEVQSLLAGEMVRAVPDFVLHTGDLVYWSGDRRAYHDRFFTPYGELLRQVTFWPSLGNHDVAGLHRGRPYLDVFELPENGPSGLPAEHNYHFDYASARVAVIDSNLDEQAMVRAVAPWLVDIMSAPELAWRFVAVHHPPYTAGLYPPDSRVQRALVPAFESAGIDLVFAGHDHNYQRTHPLENGKIVEPDRGVIYIVTGAGGGELYPVASPELRPVHFAAVSDRTHSFTVVSIDGDTLTLQQLGPGGAVLDELRRVRGRAR